MHFTNDIAQQTKFTVSFYDENGGLLENQSVRYRGTANKTLPAPSLTPNITSTGVIGKKWDWYTTRGGSTLAQLTNVKENKTIFAGYMDAKFTANDCSWSIIKEVSNLGYASGCFVVGDEKVVTINDTTKNKTFNLTMQIADFNHDVDASGNTIGITWVTKELLPEIYNHKMNDTTANAGGWNGSSMRTYLNNDIYNLLPADLKASITSAAKKSTAGNVSTALGTTSEDKLCLLSLAEINYGTGKTGAGYKDEGTPYALYADWNETNNGDYSMRIKKYAGTGSASSWWLRSPNTSNPIYFWYVGSSSGVGGNYASTSYGVCFAFCV